MNDVVKTQSPGAALKAQMQSMAADFIAASAAAYSQRTGSSGSFLPRSTRTRN
jgi:hypothetical protein